MKQRVALLKENRMEEYYAVMDKTASTFHAIDYQVTKLASQFIDIDEENYAASMEEAEQHPEIAKQLNDDADEARTESERFGAKLLDEALAKQVYIERLGMEFDLDQRMAEVRVPEDMDELQFHHNERCERTLIMDTMYMKYGVTFADTQMSVVEYDLDNNEDVKKAMVLTRAQHDKNVKQEQQQLKKEMKMTREERKEIKDAVVAIGPINFQPDFQGCIPFASFLKIFNLIVEL